MPAAPVFIAFLGFGGGETVLVLLVVLMLFGGERMPAFARGLGKAIREFKKATSGVEEQIKRVLEEPVPSNRTIKSVSPEKSVPSEPAKLPPVSAPAPPPHPAEPEPPPPHD